MSHFFMKAVVLFESLIQFLFLYQHFYIFYFSYMGLLIFVNWFSLNLNLNFTIDTVLTLD